MTGFDIMCYLGATLFHEEFKEHNTCNIDDKKFVTLETLNLIIYYIDLEFYRRYGVPAVNYDEDLLVSAYNGPMYESIDNTIFYYGASINYIQKLGNTFYKKEYRRMPISCELKDTINCVYTYLYNDISDRYNKNILIDKFKRTKLYIENHSEYTNLMGAFSKESNNNLKNLAFLQLAFKKEYNPVLYRQKQLS